MPSKKQTPKNITEYIEVAPRITMYRVQESIDGDRKWRFGHWKTIEIMYI